MRRNKNANFAEIFFFSSKELYMYIKNVKICYLGMSKSLEMVVKTFPS